jgi:RNA polymerase sigma-70 factor (ECF subfamily)
MAATLHACDLAALVTDSRAGDEVAWERLVERVLPLLRAAARGVTRDPSLVEDAVQEALLVLYRRLPELDFAAAEARSGDDAERAIAAWLSRTADFSARSLRRAATRRRRHEYVANAATSDYAAQQPDEERAGLVRAMLAELPAPQRELVERRILHGEDTASVASSLGITANAAAVRLHRALATLRERCLARDPALASLLFLVLLRQGRAEAAESGMTPTTMPTSRWALGGGAVAAVVLAGAFSLLGPAMPPDPHQAGPAAATIAATNDAENSAQPTPLAAAWYAAGASLLGEAVLWAPAAASEVGAPGPDERRELRLDDSTAHRLDLSFPNGSGRARFTVFSHAPTHWRWGSAVAAPAWSAGWTPPRTMALPAGRWTLLVEVLRISTQHEGPQARWEWRCQARGVTSDGVVEILLGHGFAAAGPLLIAAETPTALTLTTGQCWNWNWADAPHLEQRVTTQPSVRDEPASVGMLATFSVRSGAVRLRNRDDGSIVVQSLSGPAELRFRLPGSELRVGGRHIRVTAPPDLPLPRFFIGPRSATTSPTETELHYAADGWWQAPTSTQRLQRLRGPDGPVIDSDGGLRLHVAEGAEVGFSSITVTQEAGG